MRINPLIKDGNAQEDIESKKRGEKENRRV
jgi:hypothetical protein